MFDQNDFHTFLQEKKTLHNKMFHVYIDWCFFFFGFSFAIKMHIDFVVQEKYAHKRFISNNLSTKLIFFALTLRKANETISETPAGGRQCKFKVGRSVNFQFFIIILQFFSLSS